MIEKFTITIYHMIVSRYRMSYHCYYYCRSQVVIRYRRTIVVLLYYFVRAFPKIGLPLSLLYLIFLSFHWLILNGGLLRFKKKKSAGNSALILSNNGAEMENGAQKSIFYKKKGERTDDVNNKRVLS